MAENDREPLPSQAMPARRPVKRYKRMVAVSALLVGLVLFLILNRQSMLHEMLFEGVPFSWEGLLTSLAGYGYTLFFIYVCLAAVALFLENRNPDRTVAWLLVLALLPVLGFVLYWFIGPTFRFLADRRRIRLPRPDAPMPCLPAGEDIPLVKDTVQLIYRTAGSGLEPGQGLAVFHDGRDAFERIKDCLRRAEKSILLESFIINNDELGNEIKDILVDRARAGVVVCVIYDAAGSWRLGKKYVQALRDAGAHAYPFHPVAFPVFRGANYRNHRKILVIDGKTGFTGGLNIGNEYISKCKQFTYWRDTHMEMGGVAVKDLRAIFLSDLSACHAPEELLLMAADASEPPDGPVMAVGETCPAGCSLVQTVASGPDTPWDTVQKGFFSIFARARRNLWVTTPYLVPGDALMEALCLSSLSGVDVRLLLPGKSDHLLVHWASMNCCDELLRAGVRIFLYDTKAFVHAKTLTADGVILSVGSANLDTRSLQINYEVQAFIYDQQLARQEEQAFIRDMEHSQELNFASWRNRPKLHRVKESAGKVFSSLL